MLTFLSGRVSRDREDAIARHLEDCADCERLASELSDDREAKQFAGAASRTFAVAAGSAPEIEDLRRRLHALGLFSMAIDESQSAATSASLNGESVLPPRPPGNDSTERLVAAESFPAGKPPREPAPRLTQLGCYEIIRTLGSGTFGIVYLALDRRLNRQVAIKVARASVLTAPDLRARFFREAEALARLEHPHILPVYGADELDGLCYLVLAYCEGPTLEEWLQQWIAEHRRPVDPHLAARIVLLLAGAAEHAHSRGILHRDIKPANILLSPTEPTENLPFSPKLTDFGLAKTAEEPDSGTLSGMVIGTAHYMAPEQAAGHVERIGPTTDVYALGAILYQLVSGRLPIEGNSTIDTLRRLLIDEPIELARLVPEVPRDLDAIVTRCLQKSPAQRYATAAELADDLQRFLAGRPTMARPLAPAERLRRWMRKHRALIPLLALAATAIGLSLGLYIYAERLSRSQHLVRQYNERLGQANQEAQTRALYLAQQEYAKDLSDAGKSSADGDIAHAIEALSRQKPAGKRDLRGLEWHYLAALNTHPARHFINAGNPMYQLRLSPDGKELAAVGQRGLLRLFNAEDLSLVVAIPTNQVETNSIAYSANGRLAAAAGDDGTVRIFDLALRKEQRVIHAHDDKAFGVVFFDEDRQVASCGKESIVRLWDVATGRSTGVLEGHSGQVEQIEISRRGDRLASVSADKSAILWNPNTRERIHTLVGHAGPVMAVAFSPDGRWLATGAADDTVALWKVASGRQLDTVTQLDRVQSVCFSSDGKQVYAGDRSGSVHKYRVVGESPPDRRMQLEPVEGPSGWHAHDARIWCIAPGRDPATFYTTADDHLIRRWDDRPSSGVERTIPGIPGNPYVDLDYSPDGKLLFALCETSGILVIDAQTLQPRYELTCRHARWSSLEVLAGRDEVAAGNDHGIVAIWNYKTGALVRHIAPGGRDFNVHDIVYSPHTGLLVVLPYELDEVRLYEAADGRLVGTLPTSNHTAVAVSPDGRYLAVDSLNAILLFDVAGRQLVHRLTGHSGTVYSLAFSPDGKLLASASGDRTVRLWSLAGGLLANLTGHLADATEVRFTPDGRSLLSLDERGAIDVAHIATRQTLLELPAPAQHLRCLAISPDSRRMAGIRMIRGIHEISVLGPP